MAQVKQSEWREQWQMFDYDERFLFDEWILPATLESMRGKDVLECGCGTGTHTRLAAQVAKSVTAVDLNAAEVAKERTRMFDNVTFLEADIAEMDLGRQFDVVYCIGVIHHTDNPTRTFHNLFRHVKPGGTLIIWTYSSEGNFLVEHGVEPVRKLVIRRLPRKAVVWISWALTALMFPIVHTVYRINALKFLPFFEYFANFRRMTFGRNMLNVFDKLNAPQTTFTTRQVAEAWLSPNLFEPDSISIRHYVGVSYSLVATRRQ